MPNPYAAKSKNRTDTTPNADSLTEQQLTDVDPVPVGPSKEVLAWVGSDSERAQRAVDVEVASGQPRKTLIAALNERL